ncbi:CG0192-related protein [Solwaraspora sp. WMMB335]|uniref:CG0192-related protein n=1 Tax=Solwaraspora sp. WMMB335 TaxID=3404118 RepID=UPI003B9241E6
MALLHRAELRPTKLELLAAWLPGRDWWPGRSTADLERVAGYRFDDPAGDVGMETILVRAETGPVLQVPLTYRGAPLDGGDAWLVGTMDHSALGPRWVYDACGDPVYAAALAGAILADAGQAQEYFEVDGVREIRPLSMDITGSATTGSGTTGAAVPAAVPAVGTVSRIVDGDPTLIVTERVELTVLRRLDGQPGRRNGELLTGTWPGQPQPLPLAYAVPR